MSIYDVIRSVWRNHPKSPSTLSVCECGRRSRRGSEPCLDCLSDKLQIAGVSKTEIDYLCRLVRSVQTAENQVIARAIKCVGEGADL